MFKGRMLWAWQGWAMPEGRRWGFLCRHHLQSPHTAQFCPWGSNNPKGQWGKLVLALSSLFFFFFLWWQQSGMKDKERGWLRG